VSEVPTPSERGSELLDDFIGLRDTIRAKRIGHGGREVCETLTAALDRAVGSLLPSNDRMAIVAVGGYGRGEMSPYSDVDLMLLHDLEDPSDEAAALFRPLWDAKLRVGHAVRTLREAAEAARERFDTQTTLLTSRLVTGSSELFDGLMADVTAVTRARPLRRHLVKGERDRRSESPYLLMAADVKVGRGGLRTLHGFEWERRREALIGRFSAELPPEEETAHEHLLRIRNALHSVAGRAHDTFSPELREPVARWLGLDTFDAAKILVEAMTIVDGLASRRWPEVVEAEEPRRRWVWSRSSASPVTFDTTSAPTYEGLVSMLKGGESGRLAFERLWEDGLLAAMLPEWGVVESLPQLAPFHEHPVASHLWRTVREMLELIGGDGQYGIVAAELDAEDILLVSSFLHDIGKGHGGNHSAVGADITGEVCRRLEVEPEKASLIEAAVRHHLLLPITATRRDLDDPAVIDEVSKMIGDLRLLQVLYLLTVADSRATGPTMWNDWKAVLLRTLFVRCAGRFGGDRPATPGTDMAEILAATPVERRVEVTSHVEAMPDDYLRSTAAGDVVWHVDLVAGLVGASNLGVRPAPPFEVAVVVGEARHDFRRMVAAAFAANGVDVLEARLMTRSDGMVVDSFMVRDDRTGGVVPDERWEGVRSDIEGGLLGALDTASKAAARAAAYPEPAATGAPPSAEADFDAASGDLFVTVKCSDRIGRLAEILSVFGDVGLEIRLAKLDSRGGEVVDTFHVSAGDFGHEPGEIARLESRIAAGITS
jgi:[protein-PII] uridylyltransferase